MYICVSAAYTYSGIYFIYSKDLTEIQFIENLYSS